MDFIYMDSGSSPINPRASYKQALDMAGISGTGKQGKGKSALDFYSALGLNQGDSAKELQAKQDIGAYEPDRDRELRDKQLSDANLNYIEEKPVQNRRLDGNAWNIKSIGEFNVRG
jgi:hypothetical protein